MVIVEEVFALKLRGDQLSQKWDKRFLGIARLISTWSKDPSTKVGAVAVNPNRRILATGYNGFPSGCKDDQYNLDDRVSKYQMIVHAESNIIYNACNSSVNLNCSTICIFGMYPCPECVKALGQVGVARIVFQLGPSHNMENWQNQFDLSRVIMHDLGIGFTHYGN